MAENVFKAHGRKEHLQLYDVHNSYQNQYHGSNNTGSKNLNNCKQTIGEGNVDGLNWKWIAQTDNAAITTTSEKVISSYLRFKWDKLDGVLGFTGTIEFLLKKDGVVLANEELETLVEFSGQWIGIRNLIEFKKVFSENPNQQQINRNMYQNQNQQQGCVIEFSFSLTPVFATPVLRNVSSNFEKSHITDAILEVEEKQLHVNKSFLSIHSEFFDKLFNSSFKEKSQSTIVIKDVDASAFSNFLSLIYPNQVEITVETVAKYLVLADQYIMLAVTQKCEEFLLQNKRVKTIQKIVFSDQHHLHKLLRETLASVDSREELDSLTMLPEFSMLSDSTKAALLHKYMHFIN
ncbi:unnamed protein product [Caenorhabditis brenneri]